MRASWAYELKSVECLITLEDGAQTAEVILDANRRTHTRRWRHHCPDRPSTWPDLDLAIAVFRYPSAGASVNVRRTASYSYPMDWNCA